MLDLIKKIREKTGAGVLDVKKALDESENDEEKAVEILRKKGYDKALKKASREAKEGVVLSYIHSNKKIGSLVKLYCETDFVARNSEFQELGKDIAMQVAAMNPLVIKPEDLSQEIIEKEKSIWIAQLKQEGKTDELIDKILVGKEKKFREENALLTQLFVKNPDITIEELITKKISKTGENIQLGEFMRLEL